MIIDLAKPPKIRREPYLEYEFQADLASSAKVLFNDPTLSYNHLVALEINNKLLRFQLVGAQPTMTIPGDDYLVYPSVLPDIDLAYELYAGRLKEILVINSKQAQHEFSFLLETEGVTANLQPDNSIVYKDANGNTVWTIEAPYATDSNGSDVPVAMQFDGSQYTVKAMPTEANAYPIKLDPTVMLPGTTGMTLWDYSTLNVGSSYSIPVNRIAVGREDGSRLINSLTVRNSRIKGYAYLDNTQTYSTTYYQFFDKNNVAIGAKQDLIVSSVTGPYYATLDIPEGVYAIEFTGTLNSSSGTASNMLSLISVDYVDSIKAIDLTAKSLPFYATTAIKLSIPSETFNSTSSGKTVAETYDAPFGTTFTPGTYSATHYRSSIAYFNNCYVDLYNASGALVNSIYIPKPTTAGSSAYAYTSRLTSVTVPAGVVRIVLRGEFYSGSTTMSKPTVFITPGTTSPEYGTAKYSLTLTEDIQNAQIIPGFVKAFPTSPYKTYVSYNGDIPANYIEASTVTAAAGTTVYIKVSLTANESTTVTQCSNLCLLMGSSTTVVALLLDSVRSLTQSADTTADSLRLTLSNESLANDTTRSIASGQTIAADSSRHTQESTTASVDTLRTLTATQLITAAMDTLRKIAVSHTTASDSIRMIQAGIVAAAKTLRRTLNSLLLTSDSQRRVKKRIPFWCDTKRNSTASSAAAAETKRCLTINQQCTSDTKRDTTTTNFIESDTKRVVIEALTEIIQINTQRRLLNSITLKSDFTRCILSATLAAVNTKRRSTVQQALRSDSKRKVTESAQVSTKAGRKVTASVLHKLDTNRKVTGYIHISYDTKRNAKEGLCITYDTKRIIADRTWPRAKQCTLNIQIHGKHVTIISFKD